MMKVIQIFWTALFGIVAFIAFSVGFVVLGGSMMMYVVSPPIALLISMVLYIATLITVLVVFDDDVPFFLRKIGRALWLYGC